MNSTNRDNYLNNIFLSFWLDSCDLLNIILCIMKILSDKEIAINMESLWLTDITVDMIIRKS